MNDLAPIGLSVYARVEHLKRNVAALKQNKNADRSHLYIFSDAPKDGDFKKVAEVRKYIREINGFKNIELIERDQNSRINNNRNGISDLLKKYGKIIFLEEDIVTAPGFLDFMNEALNFYAHNKNVFSITGYAPPINADLHCKDDVFVLPRFNAWGFGIWKDRYETIRYLNSSDLRIIFKQNEIIKFISQYVGEDILLMLQYEAENIIDALDVKAIFQQILTRKLTVYPKKSLVQNIGHDGSGLHCVLTDKYNTSLWSRNSFEFPTQIEVDKTIASNHQKFRKLNQKNRLVYLTKRYHIYALLRYIKSIIKV